MSSFHAPAAFGPIRPGKVCLAYHGMFTTLTDAVPSGYELSILIESWFCLRNDSKHPELLPGEINTVSLWKAGASAAGFGSVF